VAAIFAWLVNHAHVRAINNTVGNFDYGMQRRVKGCMTLSDESIEI
jgi:hypothetical protein